MNSFSVSFPHFLNVFQRAQKKNKSFFRILISLYSIHYIPLLFCVITLFLIRDTRNLDCVSWMFALYYVCMGLSHNALIKFRWWSFLFFVFFCIFFCTLAMAKKTYSTSFAGSGGCLNWIAVPTPRLASYAVVRRFRTQISINYSR